MMQKFKITVSALLLTALFILFPSCKKNKIKNLDKDFCEQVEQQDFDALMQVIDDYLSIEKLDNSDASMDKLNSWMQEKECVNTSTVSCYSCIKTNPATSEIQIEFSIDDETFAKVLDISMDDQICCSWFHQE